MIDPGRMGQADDRRPGVDGMIAEEVFRPPHIGMPVEGAAPGEFPPGVEDHRRETAHLGHPRQGFRNVHGTGDHQPGRRPVDTEEASRSLPGRPAVGMESDGAIGEAEGQGSASSRFQGR
ncbi:MAG: hypothetical protein NVV74_00455 [Magnetospirillum sp.]|nr:hypothetical protein [Magnetospirillum sp.]